MRQSQLSSLYAMPPMAQQYRISRKGLNAVTDGSRGGKVFSNVCLSVRLSVCFSARYLENGCKKLDIENVKQ